MEDHAITTSDGYILHIFRIPFGKKSPPTNQTRPPILIMHGLMDSSNGFIDLGPENSLGKSSYPYLVMFNRKYSEKSQIRLNFQLIF